MIRVGYEALKYNLRSPVNYELRLGTLSNWSSLYDSVTRYSQTNK